MEKHEAEYLTPAELSVKITIPLATLAYWRATRQGPPFLRVGRHVRYDVTDVHAWISQCRGGDHA
jgi:hypothetical protein